jgi:hypothetical protein
MIRSNCDPDTAHVDAVHENNRCMDNIPGQYPPRFERGTQ